MILLKNCFVSSSISGSMRRSLIIKKNLVKSEGVSVIYDD